MGGIEMVALGIIGLLGFLFCIVMLIISVIKKNGKAKSWAIGIIVCFVAFIVGVTNSPTNNNDVAVSKSSDTDADNNNLTTSATKKVTETQSTTVEETKAKEHWINAGMYKIGSDIQAGEYLIYSDSGLSYFQVSKDSSGALESILTNDNFSGTRYITVKDSQYIDLTGAKMLPIEEAPIQEPLDGKYPGGMYKVGRDIKAGEYKVVSDGNQSYIEVTKDSTGAMESIVTNDNFTAEKYITIKDGQYIKLVKCYIIVK
jgi:hypothetical protein